MPSKKHSTLLKFDPLVIDDRKKEMPYDEHTEALILSSILNSGSDPAVFKVLQAMKPFYFYSARHQVIANAILELFHLNSPIDILTITERLRAVGQLEMAGGIKGINSLSDQSSGFIESHFYYWFFEILYPYYVRRKIIEISQRAMNISYEGKVGWSEQLQPFIDELNGCRPDVIYRSSHSSKQIGAELSQELGLNEETQEEQLIVKRYLTGHKQFDQIMPLCEDKIVLLASHKAGLKSRFTNHLITTLAENYPDVSCYWVSLEDSAKEQARIYLSSKVLKRPEEIKFRLFDNLLRPKFAEWVKRWQSFDIKLRDQSTRIKDIGIEFRQFCAERPQRLKILVIDNVLSLADRDDFKYDANSMYDYIGNEVLEIKRQTHALIFLVHHFNEEVAAKSELINGYRPRLVNLKGTEVWKRVAYQTVLINYPRFYKDLLNQYSGDQKDILFNIWITDVATNRGHKEKDEESLIHWFVEPDYCLFGEIDPDYESSEEEETVPVVLNVDPPF